MSSTERCFHDVDHYSGRIEYCRTESDRVADWLQYIAEYMDELLCATNAVGANSHSAFLTQGYIQISRLFNREVAQPSEYVSSDTLQARVAYKGQTEADIHSYVVTVDRDMDSILGVGVSSQTEYEIKCADGVYACSVRCSNSLSSDREFRNATVYDVRMLADDIGLLLEGVAVS